MLPPTFVITFQQDITGTHCCVRDEGWDSTDTYFLSHHQNYTNRGVMQGTNIIPCSAEGHFNVKTIFPSIWIPLYWSVSIV